MVIKMYKGEFRKLSDIALPVKYVPFDGFTIDVWWDRMTGYVAEYDLYGRLYVCCPEGKWKVLKSILESNGYVDVGSETV